MTFLSVLYVTKTGAKSQRLAIPTPVIMELPVLMFCLVIFVSAHLDMKDCSVN